MRMPVAAGSHDKETETKKLKRTKNCRERDEYWVVVPSSLKTEWSAKTWTGVNVTIKLFKA